MTSPAAPFWTGENVTLYHGDCIEVMAGMPANSIDAIVCDPPYGLEFMGKGWDGADGFRRSLNAADVGRDNAFGRTSRTSPEYRAGHLFQEWCAAWTAEALRVLKPGGHLLAFGGTRTWHRLAAAVEDARFEIRDSLAWLYGSGFPKSLDVSKAIDKAAGAERAVSGPNPRFAQQTPKIGTDSLRDMKGGPEFLTAPATDAAQQWAGWGTALKPAFEPIVFARKPLVGTVAQNVLTHGTGALNIDGCRIHGAGSSFELPDSKGEQVAGRWPANVVLDVDQAAALDKQTGTFAGVAGGMRQVEGKVTFTVGEEINSKKFTRGTPDIGGASRFFYVAKAPTVERPKNGEVAHPTVKPIDLMQWLVRLVTPPGGTVLDPFAGSGTTGEAAVREGFSTVLIEREADYLPLIRQRFRRPIDYVMEFE